MESFKKHHPFFIGIDSDGTVFDTMEIKHKECFCPAIILYWDLQPVARYARQAAEFVNLYSRWRGVNRWPALVKIMDLLRERKEVVERGARIPELPQVRAFVASGSVLSNQGLADYVGSHPHPELEHALAWSEAVNQAIEEMVHGIPPFPHAMKSLREMQGKVDMLVTSGTPVDVIQREWQEHDLLKYAQSLAGQEMGTKERHILEAVSGNYAPDHMLMIGDAPGDLGAARACKAFFFPILPGREEESWQCFYQEGFHRFIQLEFDPGYQQRLIEQFMDLLPEIPPWEQRTLNSSNC
jgi:phosphoglycolate phosphatase-like HAD superfamily hydrolase